MGITKNSKQKGQSTIEFVLTFSLAFSFLFLFLKMAMNYTDGFMVHHATYMASRTYLVVDAEKQSAEDGDSAAFEYSKIIFKKYLPNALIKNFDGELKENSPSQTKYTPFIGLFIKYTTPFSVGVIGGRDLLDLRSESFLGREPTRTEVYDQECMAIKTVTRGSCEFQLTLDDNGA